jgi:hypothetical protein
MSKKYISPVQNANFVYPNNDPTEYDIEIIHDINNNSVSGTVTNFSATTISTSAITFTFDYVWASNNAETFIRNAGTTGILSVHLMIPGQTMYKPFRIVYSKSETNPSSPYSGTATFTTTPYVFGFNEFTSGDYYFEIRFIGHRAIFPVCQTYAVTMPVPLSPTPTPTPTPTQTSGLTPTPTPTPTVTPSSGGKSLEIYARDIDGTPSTLTLFYSKNGGGNINIPGATGTQLPGTCTYIYTISGLSTSDSIQFGTSIACVMNGNGSSSSCPFSSGSATTYTYVIDAPSIQQVAITIDSGTIP